MTRTCTRCGGRAVVEASEVCLLCGHVGRPGADRVDDLRSLMSSTHAAVADLLRPADEDGRFEDEEAV